MRNRGHVEEWLGRAQEDRLSAQFLLDKMQPVPYEVICYLCQQASEKMLKALLFALELPLEKSHDLTQIAERISTKIPVSDAILKACAILTPYSVHSRYPSSLEIDGARANHAVSQMNAIFVWARVLLES